MLRILNEPYARKGSNDGDFPGDGDFFHKILCSILLNLQKQMGKTWQSLFNNKIEKVTVPLWKILIYNNSEMRSQPVILFGNLQEKQKVIFFLQVPL